MVSDEIARAHEHEQMRKIFVGGLNWETSDESLKKYFGKYGNIVDCVVMRDNNGKSRGFGFVTFDKVSCVDDCIAGKPHRLDDRDIEPKRAVPKDEASNPAALARTRKIFVGGLASSTTEDDIKAYFTGLCNNFNRGNVLEVELKRDRNTDRIRGFAFVTFDDEDVVEKIVSMKYHEVKLKECEVKKAESRAAMQRRREQDEEKSGGGGGGGGGGGSGKGSSGAQNSQQGFNPNMGGWGGAGFPFFGPGGFWGGPGQGSGGGGGNNEGQGQSGGGNRGGNNQGGNMGPFGGMGPFGPGFGFPGFGFPGFGPGFGFYGMPFGWGGPGVNQDGGSDKGSSGSNDRNDGNRNSSGYSGNSSGSSGNQGTFNSTNQGDYGNNSGGNFGRMTPAEYMSMAANMGNFGGQMGGGNLGGGAGGSGSGSNSGAGGGNMSGASAMANMASMGFNNPWGGYPFNFSNFSGNSDDGNKTSTSAAPGYGEYQMGTYNQVNSSYGPARGNSSMKKSPDAKRVGYQPY